VKIKETVIVRQSRKYEHLKHALLLEDGPVSNRFADFSLIHNCLPDINSDEINIRTTIAGLQMEHPLLINAISGGAHQVTKVNADLAKIAQLTRSAIAVGSQYAGLEDPDVIASYKIVRDINPDGIVFANLGAHAKPDQALAAVDMVQAQAIQIHLNVAQEITMAEGDRFFAGYLSNIEKIVNALQVPVIVKEVGCGIAAEQARALANIGVQAIDIGGAGGTNFIAIEAARRNISVSDDILSWGIPSAISIVEVLSVLPAGVQTIVSGGIRTPLEAVKALSLGAASVGIVSPILKMLYKNDVETVSLWIRRFLGEMQIFMLMTGARNIRELSNIPVVITGYSREWLMARGIDITNYSLRGRHG
jgi:isopentenyl-diphosphate delta-isomerase